LVTCIGTSGSVLIVARGADVAGVSSGGPICGPCVGDVLCEKLSCVFETGGGFTVGPLTGWNGGGR
jgi:hypothetical protein